MGLHDLHEPTRKGTIIENNRLFKGCFNTFKTTKDTTDTIFRNNVIDLTVDNGVDPFHEAPTGPSICMTEQGTE